MDGKVGVVIGVVGCLVGLAGFGWKVYSSGINREDAQKRPVIEKELEACIEANKLAGDIIGAKEKHDAAAARKALTSFEILFDGQILVTGDKNVVTAAANFLNCSRPSQCMFLRERAIDFTNACRTSVVGSVNAAIPPLFPPTITTIKVN